MDQNFQSDNQYFANYSQYSCPNYYNYSYYNYYQEQIPDQFHFATKAEDCNYSHSPLTYSNSLSTSIDKSEFFQTINSNNSSNYGMSYGFNDSHNLSYNNDSAYQTQLETSSSYYSNYNLYEKNFLSNINQCDVTEKKRPRNQLNDEDFYYSNEIKLECNKRPKIFKLNTDEQNSDQHYCEECGQSFTSKAKFLLHQFKTHRNGSSCICPVCYKKFGNQANTLVHLRGHTQEKTYKCDQCSHAFYDSSTLKKHLRTHTGEKPYKCHLCTKKFTQSGNLKRHLLVHKKYDEDLNTENIVVQSENKVLYDWNMFSTDTLKAYNFDEYCLKENYNVNNF